MLPECFVKAISGMSAPPLALRTCMEVLEEEPAFEQEVLCTYKAMYSQHESRKLVLWVIQNCSRALTGLWLWGKLRALLPLITLSYGKGGNRGPKHCMEQLLEGMQLDPVEPRRLRGWERGGENEKKAE